MSNRSPILLRWTRAVARVAGELTAAVIVFSFFSPTIWSDTTYGPGIRQTSRTVELLPFFSWRFGPGFGCGRGFCEEYRNYGPVRVVHTSHWQVY
jgi:hypothetical protein